MNPRPVMIYTIVWGKYVDWFRRALCRSLSYPKNKAALSHPDTRWWIYGDLKDTQAIYEGATTVLPCHQIELKEKFMAHAPGVSSKDPNSGQVNLLECMMQTMRRCLDNRVSMLTAPPDTIFSEGAIDTLMAYSEQPGTCVAVPHPRVLPELMNELGQEPMSNAKLVHLALEKHPHDAWKTANIELAVSGINVGGIAWQRLEPGLYAVQHKLPTCYMTNFTEEDRKFFSRPWKNVPPQYGMWDHEWPGANLIPHERQRTLGSSDLCFIVECTERHRNTPTQRRVNPDNKTAFHRDELHNRVNGLYYSCFRGEG